MAGFVLALVFGVVGGMSRLGTRCDLVEINHYSPEDGSGFTQMIAWDWCPQYHRWHAQQRLILTDWTRVGDVVTCRGSGENVRIASRLFRETWTTYDPERENQRLFPANERRVVWR